MFRPFRILTALGAVFLAAIAFAACGDSVPGNAVANVSDVSNGAVTKKDFDKWMLVAAKASQQQIPGQASKVTVPDAPDFKKCIAAARKAAPAPAKGQPRQTDAQFKKTCQQQYDNLKDQVMQFLISARWIEGEASDLGIKLTDTQVQQEFAKQKKASFQTTKQFQDFLKSSGMTEEDLLFRVRLDTLSNKIRDKVTKGKAKVTAAQIKAYYDKNKQQFSQPETRDLSIVQTQTKAKADQAKAALDSGQSFASVAKQYSIDDASKAQGGKLPGVQKGQQEKALEAAAFAAPTGQVLGPVKTQFGYYVFKVDKITKATQQSLAQATPTIKQLVAQQNQQKALDSFVKDFQKKWQDRTNCRKGYVVQSCKGAPKPKQATSGQTVPGGATQQAPAGQQTAP